MANHRSRSRAKISRSGLRIVGVVRLSRVTDVTTSPERQKEAIERWAAENGHTIVGWAEDLDVSGSTDPFERDELGPWLVERTGEFDGLCAAKIDRWARSIVHFSKLLAWCEEHDKLAATADRQLHTSEPSGKLIAYVAAIFAEMELDAISERVSSARAKLRQQGKWPGGMAPFGYQTTHDELGRATGLAIDPERAPWARAMVANRLEGWSFQKIADWLGEQGVTSIKGKPWVGATVAKFLGGRHLIGQAVHQGKTVTDGAGEPIQFAEPLISFEDFEELRPKTNVRNDGTGLRRTTRPKTELYLLRDFLRCGGCGKKMYRFVNTSRGVVYIRYGCNGNFKQCPAPASVKLDRTDQAVTEQFLDAFGDQEVYEHKFIPATGTAAQLERLARTIKDLRDDRDAGLWEGEDEEYRARMKALIDKRGQLEAQPADEARWEYVPTGTTYSQAWEAADIAERRDLLATAGFHAVACRSTIKAPDWYDPDQGAELALRTCIVYVGWSLQTL
ncbi:recombinase family protein [Glycomyces sp. NPDC047369]